MDDEGFESLIAQCLYITARKLEGLNTRWWKHALQYTIIGLLLYTPKWPGWCLLSFTRQLKPPPHTSPMPLSRDSIRGRTMMIYCLMLTLAWFGIYHISPEISYRHIQFGLYAAATPTSLCFIAAASNDRGSFHFSCYYGRVLRL